MTFGGFAIGLSSTVIIFAGLTMVFAMLATIFFILAKVLFYQTILYVTSAMKLLRYRIEFVVLATAFVGLAM
jgi:hypothetical protein